MRYLVKDILRDVRIQLDLDAEDQPLICQADPPSLTIDKMILAQVEWGARLVIEEAPVWKLHTGIPITGGVASCPTIFSGSLPSA